MNTFRGAAFRAADIEYWKNLNYLDDIKKKDQV